MLVRIMHLTRLAPLLTATVIGVCWIVLTLKGGVGLTPDSTQYMTFALYMKELGRFTVNPLWPPLYPALLSSILYLTPFPAEAAAWVSAACLPLYVLLSVCILRQARVPALVQVLLLAALSSLLPFLYTLLFARSECPYTVLLALHILFVVRYHRTGKSSDFIAAAASAGLAALTRYVGYAAFASLGMYVLYVFLTSTSDKRGRSLIRNTCILVLAYAPVGVYTLRNYFVMGKFHGARPASRYAWTYNAQLIAETLLEDASRPLQLLFAGGVLALTFSLLKRRRHELRMAHFTAIYILINIGFYCLQILYSTSRVGVDVINSRYFGPVYPLLYLAAVAALIPDTQARLRRGGLYLSARQWATLAAGLLLTADTVSHLRPLRTLYWELTAKREHGSMLVQPGFEWSSTARELSAYIAETLEDTDSLNVAVINDYRTPTRPHMARPLFFRASVYQHPAITFQGYESLHPFGYTVTVRHNGKAKRLRYFELPRIEGRQLPKLANNLVLAEEIVKVLNEDGVDSFHLIVRDHPRITVGHDIDPDLLKGAHLTASHTAAPYVIYRFSF